VVASLNDVRDDIEKDILVTEILDKNDLLKTVVRGCKLVIDVNGPFHFPRNLTDLLGNDVLKARLLESLGYKYVSLNYFDWLILEDS